MISKPLDGSPTATRAPHRRPVAGLILAVATTLTALVTVAMPCLATPTPAKTPARSAIENRLGGLDGPARRPLLRDAVLDRRLASDARRWALATAVADLADEGTSPALLLDWAEHADRSMRRDLERAYWRTLAARAEDDTTANAYLFEALRGRSLATRSGTVRRWAARTLCARGADWAWDEIRAVFDPASRDDALALALCEKQIHALTECGDPARGLVELLRRPDTLPEQPVHQWAIGALAALGTDDSRSFLIAYGLRVQHSDWRRSRLVAGALRTNGVSNAALLEAGFLPNPPSLYRRLHGHGQP